MPTDHLSHHHPRLRLSFVVALLSMLAPFSIDTYLPSFPDIAREFVVSPVALQQTLSLYLLAFAVMMLVYGPLSDAFGRRGVILVAVVVYVASSIGCALAPNVQWLLAMRIVQGLSASAGVVVGRAVVRDAFAGATAQRVMSQVMLIFALAPAIAPIVGGWLHDAFGWRSVFWFLTLLGVLVWLWAALFLPETLPPAGRHRRWDQGEGRAPRMARLRFPGHPRVIAKAYVRALGTGRFMLLVAIIALNFGGFFLYVAGSPAVMYRHLHYAPNEFGRLFVPLVAGLMAGAYLSGRVAGRMTHSQAVGAGFGLMLAAAALNMTLALVSAPTALTVIAPVVLYAFGMSLAMPNLSLLALDMFPAQRGLSSALQGFSQAGSNAIVAGVLVPLLASRVEHMAAGMLLLNLTGLVLWILWRRSEMPEVAPAPPSPMGSRRGPQAMDGLVADSPMGSRRGPQARDGLVADSPMGSSPSPRHPCRMALDSIQESRRGARATTAGMQEVEQRREQLPKDGAVVP